jgi:SEC-C motif-containing protein
MLSEPAQKCPCGSGESFKHCCENFINKTAFPENPEQLMRSRYSAYVCKNEDYLLNSWHPSTRPQSLNLQNDATQWKKLKIISAKDEFVHFVAFFTEEIKGIKHSLCLSEKSIFVKEAHWFYLEGTELKTLELTQNMSCPCQSGKKFKRCCATEM